MAFCECITPTLRHCIDLGRNPGGIRFGSSELYDVIESCFSSPTTDHTIIDSLAVGQKTDGGLDERVILFVKLSGRQLLSAEFRKQISNEIRSRRSPRHVPAEVSRFAVQFHPF